MKNYLDDVQYANAYKISEGRFVHNYGELVSELRLLSDLEFKEHVGQNHDSIILWISENQKDSELISRLKGIKSRKKYISIIEHRIKTLQDYKMSNPATKSTKIPFILIILVLLVAIILQHYYFKGSEQVYERQKSFLKTSFHNQEVQISELQNKIAVLEIKEVPIEELEHKEIPKIDPKSPKDRVNMDNIRIQSNRVYISLPQPVLTKFTDTKSMLPILNSGANAIEVSPETTGSIQEGDIISYKSFGDSEILVHRVIEIGTDEQGWYAIAKGDNNPGPDPGKIRFDQIERIVVGIIY